MRAAILEGMNDEPANAPLPGELLDAVAARFRLLGAPSRLKILQAVLRGPRTMTELQAATGLEQSNLSRRVGELEAGGLVHRRRRGRQVIVEAADGPFEELCALARESLPAGPARAHASSRTVPGA